MEKKIEIYGDIYSLRETFDIVDYRDGIYGFDVSDDSGKFLFHCDTNDVSIITSEIKWVIYKSLI